MDLVLSMSLACLGGIEQRRSTENISLKVASLIPTLTRSRLLRHPKQTDSLLSSLAGTGLRLQEQLDHLQLRFLVVVAHGVEEGIATPGVLASEAACAHAKIPNPETQAPSRPASRNAKPRLMRSKSYTTSGLPQHA